MLKKWYGFFGWLWSSPVTIIMLFVSFLLVVTRQMDLYNRFGWILEFTTVKNSWWERTFWKSWAGGSIAGVIWYHRAYVNKGREETEWQSQLKRHERRHSEQWFVFGVLFVIAYPATVLFIFFFLKNLHSYHDHPAEVDARRAAGQLIKIPRSSWMHGPDDRIPWI
jgi:hypothetical protein